MMESLSKSPVIIGGFLRTGSSLSRRLLDSHSKIHCGPEVKFFQDLHGEYINDPYAAIRFFTTIRSLGLSTDEVVSLFGPAFIKCHELVAQKQGKSRWADKVPENALYLKHWQHLLHGNFVFIHTVRHPLDALASLNEAGFEKTVPAAFSDKVALYERFLQSVTSFNDENPEQVVTLRYEDLVSIPQQTLARLLSEIGESFEPEMLSAFTSDHRQSGLEDPKVRQSTNIHANSIGRWRTDLTASQVARALDILQPWMQQFEYQV